MIELIGAVRGYNEAHTAVEAEMGAEAEFCGARAT